MFNKSFPLRIITNQKKDLDDNYSFIEYTYSFWGKEHNNKKAKRYIVIVEQYTYAVYVIKFCLQERKIYTDRFNVLTGLNECGRILATLGNLVIQIFEKDPFASFGFIGSNSPNESKDNTKRFRLYTKVVEAKISTILFEHRMSKDNSAYLLLNRDNNKKGMLDNIVKMFNDIYIVNYTTD